MLKGGLGGLMKQAQMMQENMKKAQERRASNVASVGACCDGNIRTCRGRLGSLVKQTGNRLLEVAKLGLNHLGQLFLSLCRNFINATGVGNGLLDVLLHLLNACNYPTPLAITRLGPVGQAAVGRTGCGNDQPGHCRPHCN